LYKLRCGTTVSSSKVRLSVERAEIVVFPLIFTGTGERDNGDICTAVVLLGSGNRMGRAGEASVDVVGLDDMADAETGVVCGSLRPLRNGLKNQDGANLDVKELREELASRRRSPLVDVAVDVERFERTERIDDSDGEVLRVVTVDLGVLCNMLTGRDGSPESSDGNSVMTRLGLSSIGAILLDMIELRWVAMVRLSIIDWYDDEPMIVPLPVDEDVNELRFKFGGRDGLESAKVSISALSASALLGGPSSNEDVSP
jgi:hypothetical protein